MTWRIAYILVQRYGKNILSSPYIRRLCSSKPTPEKMQTKPSITQIERNFQENTVFGTTKTVSQMKTGSQSMKYSFVFLGISLTAFGTFVIYELGRPLLDEKGRVVVDEFSQMALWKQYLSRSLKQIEHFALIIQEPSRDKLLPDAFKYPYYQPPYTLVIEFTDVMAHPEWTYTTGWRFKKRPGLDYLLENLVGLYEIVVFTAEPGITIFPVIEAVDPKNYISYKLVRDSTHFIDGHHVKNLSKLNRDLSKVVVVDWNSLSVKFHPENHLNITRWTGDDDDNTLIDLTCFLKTIAHTEIEDVRDVLRYYQQFDDPLSTFRKKQIEYYEMQEQLAAADSKKKSFKRFFDYIL